TWSLDLNAEYRPTWAGENQPLAFTANVFNVFSKKEELAVIEVGESSISSVTGKPVRSVDYLRPVAFQTPPYFQFAVRYDFSLEATTAAACPAPSQPRWVAGTAGGPFLWAGLSRYAVPPRSRRYRRGTRTR